jgi:Outer membrane protein beta-barrel domain
MGKSIFITVLMIAISGLSQAQGRTRVQPQSDEERKLQVYALAGLADFSTGGNGFQIGGGVDAFVFKGFSVGGELSHISSGANQFLLSANGSYHFLNGSKANKFDPFATFGYSRLMNSGAIAPDANAVNFGGGVNYWLSDKFGLRADLRDHIGTAGGSLIGLRGGLVFSF